MPHNDHAALSGIISHVFAHRFTLEADGRTLLADLGPRGAEAFPLETGLAVTIEGERRPSEIKVTRIAAAGRDPVSIHHKKPHHAPRDHGPEASVDPSRVFAAVRDAGWNAPGALRRKPKHFEVLARKGDAPWMELHASFDGTIYKERAADPAKWELSA